MKDLRWTVLAVVLGIAACSKQESVDPAVATSAPASPAPEAGAPAEKAPAELSYEERQRAEKQGRLDYATMEDQYLNDPKGQWAASATASSTFGQSRDSISDSSRPQNVVGKVDSKSWTNDQQDVGFDWLEVTFARPVNATELRVVFEDDDGVEAINKLELQDVGGSWHTVWSGLSDVNGDERGSRTWFVRKFDKTTYQVKAAKVTIANNVQSGYKVINAVQLVGE
jgi:hypothetical protein